MLPDLTNVQRVLVMQVGSRQDLMQTIPALQKLRDLLGDATITLMVSPCSSEISIELPWVDEVFVYEGGNTFVDAERELALISKLRQSAFDCAVIFTNPRESPYPLAYICYLAGIPIRIGQSQEFGGGVLSEWLKLSAKDSHPVDKHFLLIKSLVV
ncbi:glycosyltransferase family 9 protein [Tolypothrix campylonemoides VB511288]|nr:glycosyltransferase family 9 protein [Tolypothrix campylonemoides VB511288]